MIPYRKGKGEKEEGGFPFSTFTLTRQKKKIKRTPWRGRKRDHYLEKGEKKGKKKRAHIL